MLRRTVIAVAIGVLLLAGTAVAATRVRWSGHLGQYGNGVGLPVPVGAPFSVGMTELQAGNRVRIESVRLHRASRSIVLVGARVYREGEGEVGYERRFPPRFPPVKMRSADGAVVLAGTTTLLVVGMRATHPGGFRIHGFDVFYRERWHGIDVKRKAHVGVVITGCAGTGPSPSFGCRSPHMGSG